MRSSAIMCERMIAKPMNNVYVVHGAVYKTHYAQFHLRPGIHETAHTHAGAHARKCQQNERDARFGAIETTVTA